MAVAGQQRQEFHRLISHQEVDLRTTVAIRIAGGRRERADLRDAIGAIPGVVGGREPKSVPVELDGEFVGRLYAQAQLRIVHVLPGE